MKLAITKNKWLKDSDLRLDASFHLSAGQLTLKAFKKANFLTKPLNKVTERIFYGGRSRRNYVNSLDNGLPFIKGADIIKADFSNLKIISKKRTANLNDYFLEEGWTVITRSGTIGNSAFVNKDFIGKAASDDIIRIVPKSISAGFLYAFLSSKNGKELLTHGTYGAVIQHIEPEHIENIPVPIFREDKDLEIHNLIVESAELRVEANKLQREAIDLIENTLPIIGQTKQYVSSISNLSKNNLRFDASTNFANIELFYNKLSGKFDLPTVGELSEKVFTPNIFKRLRVDSPDFGIPFLSGSDLLDAMPSFNSFLSKRMKNIDDYILHDGWIAIQDAGTIGYVTLVNGYLDGVAATNNLVRIVPKANSANYYIYAFLKTKQGQTILKSYEYGSVQKHIDNNQVSQIKIPIISEYEVITNKISDYLKKTTEACLKENQAIRLVENEIEKWQN